MVYLYHIKFVLNLGEKLGIVSNKRRLLEDYRPEHHMGIESFIIIPFDTKKDARLFKVDPKNVKLLKYPIEVYKGDWNATCETKPVGE